MCDNCICQPVCEIFRATGGVKKCKYHKEERKGVWEKTDIPGYLRCSCCKNVYILEEWLEDGKWNGCPNCLADMREETT